MKLAAIYARVSTDRQKEEQTIASQTTALIERAQQEGYTVPTQWIFEDEGYSGAVLVRPGLERLRDLSHEGQIQALWVYSPDRLSRKYAYQVLLVEEFVRHGVEVLFVRSPKAQTSEEELLLQFQTMIAEYERAQIAERSRRGKRTGPKPAQSTCSLACLTAIVIFAKVSRAKPIIKFSNTKPRSYAPFLTYTPKTG